MSGLFQLGDFRLHSGDTSRYKIDCDALTDADLATCAALLALRVPPFGTVDPIPRGGNRLAEAMRRYANPTVDLRLVVDDVLTSGGSMTKAMWLRQSPTWGAVIFARGAIPERVSALFVLTSAPGEAAP